MQKLYTVRKTRPRADCGSDDKFFIVKFRPSVEERRENHEAIQVLSKSNPLQLYNGSDKKTQGIRSDRVHEELWTEVCNIVQEVVIKTIPKKKKCKNAKWLSEEALQIAEERRETKDKGEKKDIPIWMQSPKE